jgi:hypothetical protein
MAELVVMSYVPIAPALIRAIPFIRGLSHKVLYKEEKQFWLGKGEEENRYLL